MRAPELYGHGFPKVELHLHLDTSISFGAVAALAPATSLAEYRHYYVAPGKCTSLAAWLARPPRILALMQDRQSLRLVTEDLFDQLERDGVLYAEIRWAPHLHTEGGLTVEDVVEVVERAAADASAASGVRARLLLCTLRHYREHESLRTAQLVYEFRGSLVAGLDLAGDEAGYPLDAHVVAFRYAHEQGLPCTAHAGEAAGADSVWDTLRRLAPSRIGHGVRSVEDPALVEHLRREGIHLEVCPSCNVQTDVVDTYADHPVDELYRSGVSLGINTDARAIADVSLAREYERLRAVFGWGDEELATCSRAALEAAFLPEEEKEPLRAAFAVAR